MDRPLINFGELLFQLTTQINNVLFNREQFQFSVHKNDVRNVNKCLSFARAFTENGSRRCINRTKRAIIKNTLLD